MESGVAFLLQESRKSGRPIRVMNPVCFQEGDLSMDIRQQRKEDAEERRMRAKYEYPFKQELADARRERDYYKRLISENNHVFASSEHFKKLKENLEEEKGNYEKTIASLKRTNETWKKERENLQFRFDAIKNRLKWAEEVIEKLVKQRDDLRRNGCKDSPVAPHVIDLTPMVETAAYNTELIQKNKFLEGKLHEIVTAYNRLVFLTREKLGANAPTQTEVDGQNK